MSMRIWRKVKFLYMVNGKSVKPLFRAVLNGPQKINTDLPFLRTELGDIYLGMFIVVLS